MVEVIQVPGGKGMLMLMMVLMRRVVVVLVLIVMLMIVIVMTGMGMRQRLVGCSARGRRVTVWHDSDSNGIGASSR